MTELRAELAIEGSDDLLIKLLLLLPAKPLFRFKLVSKRWLSLISDPSFRSLWRPQPFPSALILDPWSWDNQGNYGYIPLNDEGTSHTAASCGVLDFLRDATPDGGSLTLWSSCGGLLLCRCTKWEPIYTIEAIVCNPTTKQFTTLPSPNLESVDMCLAFDYSVSPHYKVISLFITGLDLSFRPLFEIYSSETNTWRQSRAQYSEPFLILSKDLGKGVFFNGAIFWLSIPSDCYYYFDIDSEIVHKYPMPKIYTKYYFGCVREHLYLVSYLMSQLDIFELGNDYSWSLKYCIDLYEVAGRAFPNDSSSLEFDVLSIVAREGDQEPHLALYIQHQFILLSLKDNTCSEPLPYASVGQLSSTIPTTRAHHLIENPFWAGVATGQPKKRTLKKFSYRGVDLDALLDTSTDELVKLFPARARRRLRRGLKRKPMALIKKLRKAKREAPAGEKPEVVRTHLRNMIIVPEMIGSVIGIYNGKTFNQIEVKPEMLGHYLAEFSISYKLVTHGRPGIGATHSSRFIPLK